MVLVTHKTASVEGYFRSLHISYKFRIIPKMFNKDIKKNNQEEYHEGENLEELTYEEREELEFLYEEEMAPNQDEEDWMIMLEIKHERKNLVT